MLKSFLLLCVAASLSMAAPILVRNTGLTAGGTQAAAGAMTAFWTLTSGPAGFTEAIGSNPFRYYNGAYYADNAASAWVSPAANGNASVGGFFVYSLTIDLTGLNPSTGLINGTFGTDNDGAIFLNGGAPVATTGFGSFGAPTVFSFNSGFVAGLNTISLRVNNGGNPTSFRVEFTSATADPIGGGGGGEVPEPSTAILMVAGLAGLGLFARRK